MTELRGWVQPTRRANVLGVHSLDHFNIAVPDLKVAQNFYTDFGLDVRETGNVLDVHCFGHAQRWLRVSEAGRKSLNHLSFGIFADDLVRFKAHLETLNIKRLDPPPGMSSNGIWFLDCNQMFVEIKVAEKVSPSLRPSYSPLPAAHGFQAAHYRGEALQVRPHRMAHVLMFVPDVSETVKFYTRVLGLKLSDEVSGFIAFMHAVHGSDHHVIAFAKSAATGLHHCSWDVGSVNEVGQGAAQMLEKGFAEGWGLGRFVLGSNYFHYVRDPWGSYSEYVSDCDYIPVNVDYESKSHPGEKVSYLWGPAMPKDFTVNYEIIT